MLRRVALLFSIAAGLCLPAAADRLSGRVVDILTGRPVSGARVRLPGTGEDSTNAHGHFSIRGAPARSVVEVVVTKWGHYLKRKTWISTEGPVELDLIPTRSPVFDLTDYELLARTFFGKGTAQNRRAIRGHSGRWTTEPSFLIAGRLCSSSVWGERVPDSVFREARRRLKYAAPLLTGGFVKATTVKRVEVSEGEPTASFFQFRRAGEVQICLGAPGAGIAREEVGTGRFVNAFFYAPYFPESDSFPSYVFYHELAHALGMMHPAGYRAFALPSLLGKCGRRQGPEDMDILAGLVQYSRPPGNRYPDRDPRPTEVSSARAARAATRSYTHEWDDTELFDVVPVNPSEALTSRAATASQQRKLAEFSGLVARGGARCPESLNKPCVVHRIELETRVNRLRVELTWSGRTAGLGLHLYDPATGSARAFVGKSLLCRKQRGDRPRLEILDYSVGPGPQEIRVLYWSGTQREQAYTVELFEDL